MLDALVQVQGLKSWSWYRPMVYSKISDMLVKYQIPISAISNILVKYH